jgi:single-strand DNA-binding protein
MATLNQVMFIGHLGKDPEISTVNNKLLAKFSLAVDQKDNQTMWLNVSCWEKKAEIVEKYAHKGTPVFIQGQLQVKKYTDRNTQAERLSVEIIASNLQLLGERQKEADVSPEA